MTDYRAKDTYGDEIRVWNGEDTDHIYLQVSTGDQEADASLTVAGALALSNALRWAAHAPNHYDTGYAAGRRAEADVSALLRAENAKLLEEIDHHRKLLDIKEATLKHQASDARKFRAIRDALR